MNASKHTTHYAILSAIIVLILIRIILWNVPNNKLYELGLDLVLDADMILGSLIALVLVIISISEKNNAPSKVVFYTTQFLGWGYSIGVFVIILCFGLYATMNGLV